MGGCIPWSRVCNVVVDCPNGEDEQICVGLNESPENILFVDGHFKDTTSDELVEGVYTCKNGPNISHLLVNDLVPDCPEQDDEEKYYAFLKNGSSSEFFTATVLCEDPDATTCEKHYKDVCYPRHLHCVHEVMTSQEAQRGPNKTETCRNGAHLKDCEKHSCPSFFKCPSAFCIPVFATCNGKVDCPNGEDEEHCQSISCPGFLLCRDDRLCVHPNDVWSGRVKCPVSNDDKALRGIGACPDLCECLGNAIKCKKTAKLNLPLFPATTRMLIISNTQFAMNNLRWNGDIITLLHLQLTFCNISSVTWEHFRQLRFLQRLILRNNIIRLLPEELFQGLAAAKTIDLGHNVISKVHPHTFKGVSTVQILKLDFNKLTFLAPCTFNEMRSLTALDLSNNYLTTLGANVFCEPQATIKELYIGGNHMRHVDKRILEADMQKLLHLNITPLQICCLLPQVEKCYPKGRFVLSTCRHLLGLAFRYAIIVVGAFVFVISVCSIVWVLQRIAKSSQEKGRTRNTNLNDILNLLLFICHGLKGVHSIILACVDIMFHGYYALHEEMWKRHVLCIVLNMLLYTLVLVSIFVSLLISYMRMIACVFPFHLATVSVSKPICSIVIFLCISLSVSYLPHTNIGIWDTNYSHVALGFGLILPIVIHGQSMWTLVGVVFPLGSMLLMSSAFQIACIHALLQKAQQLKETQNILLHRRGSVVRCIATLALPLCIQLPLMFLHVVAALDIEFSPVVSMMATLLMLYGYSIISTVLYVVITPDFINCVLHNICYK